MIYYGDYCLHDNDWRSGLQCKAMGFLFTFSCHGSLFAISFLGFVRCHTCLTSRSNEITMSSVALVSTILFLVNVAHSAVPIIPLSYVQDVFRSKMSFHDNPFVYQYNNTVLRRMYNVYFGNNISIPSTYALLDDLKNTTSRRIIFDPVELGYYSYSPLCIYNIYGFQKTLFWYKVVYMISITLLLLIAGLSYIMLAQHTRRSGKIAGNDQESRNTQLSIKVMVIVGSQLLCWIPVIVISIIYSIVIKRYAPDILYEVTAIVIIPLRTYYNCSPHNNMRACVPRSMVCTTQGYIA